MRIQKWYALSVEVKVLREYIREDIMGIAEQAAVVTVQVAVGVGANKGMR